MFNLPNILANLLAVFFLAPVMEREIKCKNFLFESISVDKY